MKKITFLGSLILAIFGPINLQSQDFYDMEVIQEIRLYFDEPNWDHILDSLYVAGDEERLMCNMTINGTVLDSVGIRYKGFSSVSVDRDKNPFNIDLDFVISGQNYQGIDKVKLSNVIQDPSFLREVLSYEIARKYMPASKSNFAEIFINDVYWGLYTNVESVNKEFLGTHYGNVSNTFVKCNPDALELFGENSNLNSSPGTDSIDYYGLYDMKSDHGWADLYALIDTLNEHTDAVEAVLNVDRALWMHAFNYALINFDSYVGYAQNFYLYQDDNRQFNCIPWDLNQSFASYRLSDASEFWDGFTIEEAKTIDPLLHLNSVSVIPRPLMRNLWEDETNMRKYIAHLRTIMEENFVNDNYIFRANTLRFLIEESVIADTNKFYTDDDFFANLDNTVSDLVDYPGLTELMEARKNYLSMYPGYQNAPDIIMIANSPAEPVLGAPFTITATVADADVVTLAFRDGGSGLFQEVEMLDDGTQNDGVAGDGIYGFIIPASSSSVHYYIYAENDEAGRFSPERAAYEYYVVESQLPLGVLAINELMSDNETAQADENGEYDDWIELINTIEQAIPLTGLYLTDDVDNLAKWPLPNISMPAQSYMIVWADQDVEQGMLHANFKLSSGGEFLALAYADSTIIDEVTFPALDPDMTWGRLPNATGPFMVLDPTFAAENMITAIEDFQMIDFTVSPNPSKGLFSITAPDIILKAELMDMTGKLLQSHLINDYQATLNIQNMSSGMYILNLTTEQGIGRQKLIIEH